jgi:hypothetical protein
MKKLFVALFFTSFISSAFAFDLPVELPVDVPGVSKDKKGDSAGGSGTDLKALSDQQSAVVASLNSALRNLSKAQMVFAEALDLKEVAEVAKVNSENLAKGDLAGKDELKKVVSSSSDVQAKINKKMAENQVLSAESKVKFATGVSPYAKGTVDVVATGKNAQSATKSLSSTKDLTVLSKMATLIYVGTESPGMIKLFFDSTSTLSKFMTANGIDTKELKSASDALGE